jgi:Ca2+-binding EF-hand superfamily protein
MGASASVVEAHGFETVFANADTDGSGKLNHAEFEVAARKVTNLREPEAVDAMFRELDVDKDGLIKLTELVKACVREAKKRSVSPTRSPAALKALTLAVRTLYPPPKQAT